MPSFQNPFRPGAGHQPPHLAGRTEERAEFLRLLEQSPILENVILTGLRGVGKTVLLETLKPHALAAGWKWVGTDLSESASISEESLSKRLCADLSVVTSGVSVGSVPHTQVGFEREESNHDLKLDFHTLWQIYQAQPGLASDRLKAVLQSVWNALSQQAGFRGIIFAYDEAQNLADHAGKDEFPLSLLLDVFQSLQRMGIPVLLVLTGLPTLFPKLVDARTFSERMFRVLFLRSLTREESSEAILEPIRADDCPIRLNEQSVNAVITMSGGYPYFIQFICREVYDAFIQNFDAEEDASVPTYEIERKLDSDFFAGRWARATDRQRELLTVIAFLPGKENDDEFTIQEVVLASKESEYKHFGTSQVNQMLSTLIERGLVFKDRRGKYSFAVPLLGRYIRRQHEEV
jgi:AAA ATPase-like protein